MHTTLAVCYTALGFDRAPFAITPDTSLFFPGGQYVSAYHELSHACVNGTLAVLSGEIGLGKTLIVRCVMRGLPAHVRVAYVLNPLLGFEGMLREIYAEFGGNTSVLKNGLAALHKALIELILEGSARGERFVVIVDEAHRLSSDDLELLRHLSNLETERAKLIGLVLVGQPELDTTLSLRSMRPLRERIGLWLRLSPLSRKDCYAYVNGRLDSTHRDGSFYFTASALWWLQFKTRGVPRRINLACERAVMLAYKQHRSSVNMSMTRQACNAFSRAWL